MSERFADIIARLRPELEGRVTTAPLLDELEAEIAQITDGDERVTTINDMFREEVDFLRSGLESIARSHPGETGQSFEAQRILDEHDDMVADGLPRVRPMRRS